MKDLTRIKVVESITWAHRLVRDPLQEWSLASDE